MIGRPIYNVSEIGDQARSLVKEKSSVIRHAQNHPRDLAHLDQVTFASKETIKSAFVKVLGNKRIKDLIPEKYAIVYVYFNTKGSVLAVSYDLDNNSKLTLKEIDRLTTFIKKQGFISNTIVY